MSFESAFVVLGGCRDGGTELKTVALYQEDRWSKLGNLLKTRHGHSAIVRDDKVYIIGGHNTK